ncbi:MAG: hypothetical protein MUO77_04610 [Anaerolineales bacterium]|nr:hypothetical protein [Anaerolineales bacterium]
MARLIKARCPTANEIRWLSKQTIELVNPHQRRRADVLILYGMGLKPLEIAMSQGVLCWLLGSSVSNLSF